jgi:hypothetical protein
MTLLINGCSFAKVWSAPSDNFLKNIGVTSFKNISQVATGVQRLTRSTIEWIAQNDKPTYVILCLPFVHRWELSVSDKEDVVDGKWLPLQIKELIPNKNISDLVDYNDLKKLSDLYYKCIPDIRTYWDKAFTEIIGLTSFLENNKIDYVLFDMCNNFDKQHIQGYKGFKKLNYINNNSRIIDIFNFCGNKYIYDNLKDKNNIDPYSHHHKNSDFVYLENYLLNYINSCIKK